MLYQIQQGTVSLGGEIILDHIDFQIKGKEKIALVGKNGSGKTTLLKLIAGELELDRDDKRVSPGIWTARDTTIGLLSQSAFSPEDMEQTVEGLIMALCPSADPFSREYDDFSVEYLRIFTGLGFAGSDRNKKIRSFSGGEQTKIALIGLLLKEPDILLLDEPTNHLDLAAVKWLEDYLAGYPKAAVLVSHDRYFLDQIAQVVWELENGRLARYAGNYTKYRALRRQERQSQEKKYQAQQQEIARLTALIEKYKHKPRKASMARSKRKVLERIKKVKRPAPDQVYIFTGAIRPGELGSKRVLEAEKLKIGYDFPLREITLSVRRGQKIGIIGDNGTGKTTFLKTVAGRLPAISGKYQLGQGIHIGYYDQLTAQIDSDQRVFEHFSERFPRLTIQETKKLLGHYLFSGEETGKRLSDLSGGEKSRLYLAELLTSGPNLLLLDEPTNHMDIPSRETLESAFSSYTGTMLFISHDRYFVRQVATALLIFEDERVLYYPFGYAHYQEYLKKRAAQGSGGAGAVEAENTQLLRELRAVPERKHMQGARFNTEQSFTDWQLSLAAKALEKRRAGLEKLLSERDKEEYWNSASCREEWYEKYQKEMSDFQQACLLWYEKYIAYQEAFASYKE